MQRNRRENGRSENGSSSKSKSSQFQAGLALFELLLTNLTCRTRCRQTPNLDRSFQVFQR